MTRIFTKSCLLWKPPLPTQLTLWLWASPSSPRQQHPSKPLSHLGGGQVLHSMPQSTTHSSLINCCHTTSKRLHLIPQSHLSQPRVRCKFHPHHCISNRQQRGHYNQHQPPLQTTQWGSRRIQDTCTPYCGHRATASLISMAGHRPLQTQVVLSGQWLQKRWKW